MTTARHFPEPIEDPIDETYVIQVRAAYQDTRGRMFASASIYNGTIQYADDVQISAAAKRREFAELVASSCPGVAQDRVAASLLRLNAVLPDALAALHSTSAAEPPADVSLLDVGPAVLRRPLALVDGIAYAAVWVWFRARNGGGEVEDQQALVIVRSDGQVFSDAPLPDVEPLGALPFSVHLPEPPPPGRGWRGAGLRRYRASERPQPAEVFGRVRDVVNRFVDFNRSLASQAEMCELVATYVLVTYLLDAFNVVGYLWPNGDKGAGKTKLLHVVAEQAYLGQVILAGGSYASLRDLADYGAALCFDDAEAIMDVKRADPDKRALLLAGNRRGAYVPFKEPAGERGWRTRYVNTFCPRAFSAIRLPDDVLGGRTIVIPQVRSADRGRANADPLDAALWPHEREQLVDDLWALGLAYLADLHAYDNQVPAETALSGRLLEPWRAILAVALWLQDTHGVTGLFTRLEALAIRYQDDRPDLQAGDLTRLVIQALVKECRFALSADDAVLRGGAPYEFETAEVTEKVNAIAREAELAEGETDFTNAKRVGWVLRRLRMEKAQRSAKRKRWQITTSELIGLAGAYGVPADELEQKDSGDTPHKTAPSAQTAETAQGGTEATAQPGPLPALRACATPGCQRLTPRLRCPPCQEAWGRGQ